MISKLDVCGPITALDVILVAGNEFLVYVSSNILFFKHLHSSDIDFRLKIFEDHSIQGFVWNTGLNLLTLFGDKFLKVYLISSLCSISKLSEIGPLDDLILDCRILNSIENPITNNSNSSIYIVVGYAHNFVDVLSDKNMLLVRLFSTPCVLFSLKFSPLSFSIDTIEIASGTAFGKILIWKFRRNEDSSFGSNALRECFKMNNGTTALNFKSQGICTLSGHEGVVFRITWSLDGRRLASVSDDRSIRMWDVQSAQQLLICWGHLCRVWDVIFLDDGHHQYMQVQPPDLHTLGGTNPTNSAVLASCGEDSCVKLWGRDGTCMKTFRGHNGKNVWRVAVNSSKSVLVSGGNDAAVNLWPLHIYRVTTPATYMLGQAETPHLVTSRIPCLRPTVVAASSRRGHGVAAVKVAPDSSLVVVVLLEGVTWLVRISANELSPPGDRVATGDTQGAVVFCWVSYINLGRSITIADISFGSSVCVLVCAHDDCSVTLATWPMECFTGPVAVPASYSQIVDRVTKYTWSPHSFRTINLFFVRHPSVDTPGILVTATVKGQCALWSYPLHVVSSASTGETVSFLSIVLVTRFHCQKNIVATSCLWLEGVDSREGGGHIVVGDCDGGVTVLIVDMNKLSTGNTFRSTCNVCGIADGFGEEARDVKKTRLSPTDDTTHSVPVEASEVPLTFGQVPDPTDDAAVKEGEALVDAEEYTVPCWSWSRVHGKEPISVLRAYPGGFLTAGHDGFICIFSLSDTGSIRRLSRLSCYPIRTPDQVMVPPSDGFCGLLVGGFSGSLYQVWDLTHNVELMSVEGGSWKRCHHSVLAKALNSATRRSRDCDDFPLLSFVCAAPCTSSDGSRSADTQLQLCTTLGIPPLHPYPLHFGVPSHGKVTYSVSIFGPLAALAQALVVSGGEDGQLRCFTAPDFTLLQCCSMPSSVPIRTTVWSRCQDSARGVVVAAGGRLSFSVWSYDLTQRVCEGTVGQLSSIASDMRTNGSHDCGQGAASDWKAATGGSTGLLLEDVYSGSTWRQATQDHRILCSDCLCLDHDRHDVHPLPGDEHLLMLGDSRGRLVTSLVSPLLRAGDGPSPVRTLREWAASEYPLLCCALVPLWTTPGKDSEYPAAQQELPDVGADETHGGLREDDHECVGCVLGAAGDTTGDMCLWLIATLTRSPTTPVHVEATDRQLTSFQAHAVGCNAVSLSLQALEPTQLGCGRRLVACSGGDDQSLAVLVGDCRLTPTHTRVDEGQDDPLGSHSHCGVEVSFTALHRVRVDGCCGSAVKGLRVVWAMHRLWLLSVGYDARLSLWQVHVPAGGGLPVTGGDGTRACVPSVAGGPRGTNRETVVPDWVEAFQSGGRAGGGSSSPCDEPSLQWVHGVVCNVGDVGGLDACRGSSESELLVVVTGEGLQSFRVDLNDYC